MVSGHTHVTDCYWAVDQKPKPGGRGNGGIPRFRQVNTARNHTVRVRAPSSPPNF